MCEATCREVFQDGSQDTFFRACFGTEIRSPCGRWTCLIEICLGWLSVVTVAAVGRIAQPCIRFEHTSVTLRIDQSKVAVGSTSHCVLLISSLQVNMQFHIVWPRCHCSRHCAQGKAHPPARLRACEGRRVGSRSAGAYIVCARND